MIKKGIFPYLRYVSDFLESPIKVFRWEWFFQGMSAVRLDVVNLFHKGFINEEEQYAMIKGQKVDFGLEANEIGHDIFKNWRAQDLESELKKVASPETKWDIMPIE